MHINTVILAAALLAAGCATSPAYQIYGRSQLRNADGHVVGYTQTIRDPRSAEFQTRTIRYVPRTNEQGEIAGYEELVAGGAVLRDVRGRVIGERWVDMRSRGSNPGNSGLAIVYRD